MIERHRFHRAIRLVALIGGTSLISATNCRMSDATGPGARGAFTRRWVAVVNDSNDWSGTPAVAGKGFVVAVRGGLASFDTSTGALLWRTPLLAARDHRMFPGNVVVHGASVCAVNAPGSGCVDATTGGVLWTASSDSATDNGVSSANDEMLFYGTRNHRVVAVGINDGGARWSTDVALGAPFLTRVFGTAVRGDTVYATTVRWLTSNGFKTAGDLVALDAHTGKMLWTFTPPGDSVGFQAAPVLSGYLAILSDVYAHALRAVDLTAHAEVWRTPVEASGYVNSETAPAMVGDTVFAASTDQQLYALDVRTGQRLWRVQAADGSLYAAAPCGNQIVTTLFGGGDPHAVNRSSRAATRGRFLQGDYVGSGIAVAGTTAFVVGTQNVYGINC